MLRAFLLLLGLTTLPVLAQKPRIEAAPAENPTATPTAPRKLPSTLPTPTPAAPAIAKNTPNRTPDEIAAGFFDALKADRVDAAYDTLANEFALADRGDQEKSIREQTQKALDAYGPALGYELVREEKLGANLLRRTYLLTGAELPLRWRFYFYKPADRWKLIDLRIDDAIAEWFDDAGRKP